MIRMIEDKLKLYKNTYVKGECRSKDFERRVKAEKRLNLKLDLADTIFNELPFPFTITQKDQVKHFIITHKNFNKLHRQASNEEIILSFIFIVKMQENTRIIQKNKKLINKILNNPYKVENFRNTFEIIQLNLLLYYLDKEPILPVEPKGIDHNILYKG